MGSSPPWLRLASHPWLHLALLGGFTLAILLHYGPAEIPYRGDRSYFAYLSQSILRGDSIYRISFFGYAPLAPLLGAGAIWLGDPFGVPSYLAPRYLAVILAIADVLLLYGVARHATGSRWAAMIGGVSLAGSRFLASFSVTGLEPKMLVAFFVLIFGFSLQRQRWWGAGLAAAFAGSCWQPAGVLLALPFVAALLVIRARLRSAVEFLIGVALGLLPAVLYLGLTDSGWDFWQRSGLGANWQVFRLSAVSSRATDLLLQWEWRGWLVAALGFAGFAIGSLRLNPLDIVRGWCDPKFGGLPLLATAWVALLAVRFHGAPDLLPLLPAVGFGCAWFAHCVISMFARIGTHIGKDASSRPTRRVVGAFLLSLAIVDAAHAALEFRPATTLQEQVALVREVTRSLGPADRVAAFEAEGFLLLSERESIAPFLRTSPVFMRSAHLVGAPNCMQALNDVLEDEPAVIVIFRWPRPRLCMTAFEARLVEANYEHETLVMDFPDAPGISDRRRPRHKKLRWQVYTRAR